MVPYIRHKMLTLPKHTASLLGLVFVRPILCPLSTAMGYEFCHLLVLVLFVPLLFKKYNHSQAIFWILIFSFPVQKYKI